LSISLFAIGSRMSEFELIVMRGASGSGKSSKARTLDGMVLSTDDFFIDSASGEYRFNVALLPRAHFWNVARVEAAIAAQVHRIIVDNTNLEAWEAGPYVRLAQGARYTVKIVDADSPWCGDAVELLRRQTHGVPLESIKAQLARLESYSVAQAARAPSRPNQLSSLEQKKLKASAQRSVEMINANNDGDNDHDDGDDSDSEVAVTSSSSGSVRVEIAVNDGAKSRRKPFVIRSTDFEAFLQAALASLKLKGSAPVCYDDSGRRVSAIADIVPNSLLLFSARGEAFYCRAQQAAQGPARGARRSRVARGAERRCVGARKVGAVVEVLQAWHSQAAARRVVDCRQLSLPRLGARRAQRRAHARARHRTRAQRGARGAAVVGRGRRLRRHAARRRRRAVARGRAAGGAALSRRRSRRQGARAGALRHWQVALDRHCAGVPGGALRHVAARRVAPGARRAAPSCSPMPIFCAN
jgi:energy-coupling factor transporter ATP-binding protein EcfA2